MLSIMGYNLDLSELSVMRYKELLKNQNLLPGRRILWQNIDDIFDTIINCGIESVLQLKNTLSTPKKIVSFAANNGLSDEYLTILRREIGSFEQKPVPLSDFPGIENSLILSLSSRGIKSSKNYWESNQEKSDELYCLCDLVRINGVGAVAAKVFYEAGYNSVFDVANADAVDMLKKVSEVNKAKQYYKAKLGLKDMQFCMDFALVLVNFIGCKKFILEDS